MPSTLQRLRVFVASPGDVSRERQHVADLGEELNRGIAAQAGFNLDIVRWQTHARPDMGRPQQIILDQLFGQVDIFIGLMWHRFGTPTGVADSGTEEEFNTALASWQHTGRPRMLCYFNRAPIEPPGTIEEATQLLKVTQFRARIDKSGLAFGYATDLQFKDLLREHLQGILTREFPGRTPPLHKRLLTKLDAERQRCQESNVAFHTPNLLLALLSNAVPAVDRAFRVAARGRAQEIVDGARAYRPGDADSSFVEFDWYQRDDVKAAQAIARAEDECVVDERHLLLGFLDNQSGTREELRRALGDEAFDQMRYIAAARPSRMEGTPGVAGLFRRES